MGRLISADKKEMEQSRAEDRLTLEIDKYTQLGTSHLKQGNLEKAQKAYEYAYAKASSGTDSFIERACAFNLAAVYIASKKAQQGLELLQKAIPPTDQSDGPSNGDLYFNFGLAYECMPNIEEAVKYYELSLEEYQGEKDNFVKEAEVAVKLGGLYKQMHIPLQAARVYSIASKAFARKPDTEQQLLCMCQQALQLLQARKMDSAVELSDDCMVLCQKVNQGDILGRLYNELGLIYTQTNEYDKAATCFELALPLSRGPKGDRRRQAVILQNLGAVYNSLGDYQRALSLHENGASLHAELGNRNAQGQCFANLAYAYSQLEDHESAGECYLHALQAAKDTDDLHAQWQAMEGLGAVAFNQGRINKSVKYFKAALATLSSAEQNVVAQERIVAKLTDALQCQLGDGRRPATDAQARPQEKMIKESQSPMDYEAEERYGPALPPKEERTELEALSLMGNRSRMEKKFSRIAKGLGSYVSNQDLSVYYQGGKIMHHGRNEIQQLKKMNELLQARRVPYKHDPVALGIGDYDSESDLSIFSEKPRVRRKRRGLDEIDTIRHALRQHGSYHRGRPRPELLTDTESDEQDSIPVHKKISKHVSRIEADISHNLTRRQKRSLLRGQSYDSEGEWRERLREINASDSDMEYQERLRPPSTPAPDRDHLRYKGQGHHRPSRSSKHRHSDGEDELTARLDALRGRAPTPDEHQRVDRVKRSRSADVRVVQYEETDTESESDTDQDQLRRAMQEQLRPPSPPKEPPVSTMTMSATYERPVELPSANYFRPQQEEEPIYETIKISSLRDKEVAGPSGVPSQASIEDQPPPVPQKSVDFDKMSRAEQERFLFEYHQQRNDNQKTAGEATIVEGAELPRKQKRNKESRTCIIM